MSSDDQGGAGRREVAYRAFAAEYEDADVSYSESDEERAPNYVVLPTGARVNRLFVVGVLTEVEQASEQALRARIADPTGAFVVYAGQYQPEALAFLERAEPPAFVALTGKARTFQPDDSQVTYTSIRPESANEVDADTRDRWTVGAARQTVERVAAAARALTYEERGDALRDRLESEGLDAGLAAGIPLALDHYGTTATYLDAVRTTALDAAAVVAGERDEVAPLDVRPDERGSVDPASLVSAERGRAVANEGPTVVAEAGDESSTGQAPGRSTPSGDDDTGVDDSRTGTDEPGADGRAATAETGADATVADADGGLSSPGAADAETEASADDGGLEDFEPGEFELDDEEREEIEREYGTEFQSGAEVDDPGEADIDAPEPSDPEPTGGEDGPDPAVAGATGTGEETGTTGGESPGNEHDDATATGQPEPSTVADESEDTRADAADETDADPAAGGETAGEADADVEEAVVEAMRANDAGVGATRSDVVEAVVGQYGVDESEVDGAIQEALMDGRCYEPEDDVYKPI